MKRFIKASTGAPRKVAVFYTSDGEVYYDVYRAIDEASIILQSEFGISESEANKLSGPGITDGLPDSVIAKLEDAKSQGAFWWDPEKFDRSELGKWFDGYFGREDLLSEDKAASYASLVWEDSAIKYKYIFYSVGEGEGYAGPVDAIDPASVLLQSEFRCKPELANKVSGPDIVNGLPEEVRDILIEDYDFDEDVTREDLSEAFWSDMELFFGGYTDYYDLVLVNDVF